jgi:hypothetical protein
LSYRRLWVLVKHLPMESATQTALRDADLAELDELVAPEPEPDDRFGPWSHADYLLAELIDAVREGVYVASLAGQLDPKPKPPEPTLRPGVRRRPPPPRGMSEADFIFLNSLRAPRG